jgi:hypothetical protein
MLDIWDAAIAWPNLPLTALLAFVVLYWLGVIIGALDLDLFHLDLHSDLDAHLDLDAGADLHSEMDGDIGHAGHGALGSFAIFLNMDKLPLTLVFSILITLWWAQAVILYHFFLQATPLLAWPLHLGTLILSVVLTKFITMPLAMAKKALGGDLDHGLTKALGQIGVLEFDCSETQFSSVIIQTKGAPLIVKVKALQGDIAEGSQVVLVDRAPDGDFYYVKKFN